MLGVLGGAWESYRRDCPSVFPSLSWTGARTLLVFPFVLETPAELKALAGLGSFRMVSSTRSGGNRVSPQIDPSMSYVGS